MENTLDVNTTISLLMKSNLASILHFKSFRFMPSKYFQPTFPFPDVQIRSIGCKSKWWGGANMTSCPSSCTFWMISVGSFSSCHIFTFSSKSGNVARFSLILVVCIGFARWYEILTSANILCVSLCEILYVADNVAQREGQCSCHFWSIQRLIQKIKRWHYTKLGD